MALAYQEHIENNNSSATSLTAAGFAGLAVGNLMIAQFLFNNTGTLTVTPPAGWTAVITTTGANYVGYIAWKIADTGDVLGNSFTFTKGAGATTMSLIVSRITGNRLILAVTASAGQQNASSTTITAPTITPTIPSSMLVFFVFLESNGNASGYAIANNNPTWTEVFDINLNNQTHAIATAIRPEITATGTATALGSGVAGISLGQIISVSEQPILTASDTITSTDNSFFSLIIFIRDTITATDIASTLMTKWRNLVKNVSNWINQSKS